MDEYIERETLMKKFCERCNEEMSESPCEPSECFAREVIKELPAADVAPVRHGRWELCGENSTGDVFLCSNCKFPHNPNKRDVGLARVMEAPNFCPMCGAKMDGESDA